MAVFTLVRQLRLRFCLWIPLHVSQVVAFRPYIPQGRLALTPMFTHVGLSIEGTNIAQLEEKQEEAHLPLETEKMPSS